MIFSAPGHSSHSVYPQALCGPLGARTCRCRWLARLFFRIIQGLGRGAKANREQAILPPGGLPAPM